MIALPRTAQVALAHDWLVGLRGGEWVLDRLARLFGPTTIYTLVADGRPITEAISRCRVVASPLQQFPGAAGAWRRRYLPLMPWAVERLRVAPCDLLISTSSAVMKSIIPPPGTPHLCYCHSPARYLWEQTADYTVGRGGGLRGVALRAYRHRFQRWDRASAERVTVFLANSEHTRRRIERCYGRDAVVVYPPVQTDFFTPDATVEREEWLLIVSALEPYKRVDLALEAARLGGFRVKIVGDGSQASALRARGGPGIEWLGRLEGEALRDAYRRAAGLIFPQVEDFGIVPVEAQASGCPVLAYRAGGAVETVTDDTGAFFDAQTPAAIAGAVRALRQRAIDPAACRRNALRFSADRFDREILEQVQRIGVMVQPPGATVHA